uniref:Insulin-like 3 n=1 Tax=Echeneis naucrates TaxID=173247 RepID=A0A665TVG6_ECHNA
MAAAKCLLSAMVVLVAAASLVDAQERIKICGRELIRLAVSSCGNSRLRRSIPYEEPGQHQLTPLFTHSILSVCFLCFFTGSHDVSTEEFRSTQTEHITSEPKEREDVFSLASHWSPLSSRIRRAAGKISDVCCEKGCSLRELIQFC